MCKNDDWLSSKGLTNREAGVRQKESKEKKLCMCVFWAVCFIVWTVIGALHLSRG